MLKAEENDEAEKTFLIPEEEKIVLHIKTLKEISFDLSVDPNLTIKQFKNLVEPKVDAENKFLRLIFQGKLLSNDESLLSEYQLKSGDFIHCVVSSKPPLPPPDSEQTEVNEEEGNNRRGFNCLRTSNFSAEEIEALRLYFFPEISQRIAQSQPRENETAEEHILRVEEEWMASQSVQSEFALNVFARNNQVAGGSDHHVIDIGESTTPFDLLVTSSANEGTTVDMMWGILLGMLLGFILLFWLWERSLPRKQKLGIVIGVGINFMIGFSRSIPAH